jgi:hypothetical protein
MEGVMTKELIKIDPFNIRLLYAFIREVFTLDPASLNTNKETIRITIRPSVALLSLYKYTPLSISREKEFRDLVNIPHNSQETLTCGALSLFTPAEVPKDASFRIITEYALDEETDPPVYRPQILKVDFGVLTSFSLYSVEVKWYTNRDALGELLAQLKKLEDKNFEELIKNPRLKADVVTYFFERGLTVAGNFLYALYSGKFRSDIPLTEFTNLIQGYGDNFNEVIGNIISFGILAL